LAPQAIKTNIKNVPCPEVVAQRAASDEQIDEIRITGEPWRALATISLSDVKSRSAASAQKWVPATNNG
ncbi:hypothetical protein A2U01_0098304, partial [Trifolium medium]|nr:hypothetical protein [Trifolium medium]